MKVTRRYNITYFHEYPKIGQKLAHNAASNEVFVKSIDPSMASCVTPYGLKPGDVIESLNQIKNDLNTHLLYWYV